MAAIAMVFAALAVIGGAYADRRDDRDMVRVYCNYGTSSQAQFDGCTKQADADEIRTRTTPAARYAQGKLDRCPRDAGPYCEDFPYEGP